MEHENDQASVDEWGRIAAQVPLLSGYVAAALEVIEPAKAPPTDPVAWPGVTLPADDGPGPAPRNSWRGPQLREDDAVPPQPGKDAKHPTPLPTEIQAGPEVPGPAPSDAPHLDSHPGVDPLPQASTPEPGGPQPPTLVCPTPRKHRLSITILAVTLLAPLVTGVGYRLLSPSSFPKPRAPDGIDALYSGELVALTKSPGPHPVIPSPGEDSAGTFHSLVVAEVAKTVKAAEDGSAASADAFLDGAESLPPNLMLARLQAANTILKEVPDAPAGRVNTLRARTRDAIVALSQSRTRDLSPPLLVKVLQTSGPQIPVVIDPLLTRAFADNDLDLVNSVIALPGADLPDPGAPTWRLVTSHLSIHSNRVSDSALGAWLQAKPTKKEDIGRTAALNLERAARGLPSESWLPPQASYAAALRRTSQMSPEASRARAALWRLSNGSDAEREGYFSVLAETPDQRQRKLGAAPLEDASSGFDTAREWMRIWQRLGVAASLSPTIVGHLQSHLALPSTPMPGTPTLVAAYIRCWATPVTCHPVPLRRDQPPASAGADKPALITVSESPARPDAYWADYLAFLRRDPAMGTLPSSANAQDLLRLAHLVVGAPKGAPATASAILAPLLDRALDSNAGIRRQAAWWIEHRSAWDPLAIDWSERRFGLLQTDCAAHGLDAMQACVERFQQDPVAWLAADLLRLRTLADSQSMTGTDLANAVDLWADYYLGQQTAQDLRNLADRRATFASAPAARDFIRTYWFLSTADTDLALTLLDFRKDLANAEP